MSDTSGGPAVPRSNEPAGASSSIERIRRLERLECERLEARERRVQARHGATDASRAAVDAKLDPVEWFERLVRVPMAALGIAWAVVVVVVLTSHLNGPAPLVLVGTLFVLWGVMLVEYLVRLVMVPGTRSYVARRRVDPVIVVLPILQGLRLLGPERVSLVATELVLRTRAILVHRGLHRVLLGALGLLFIGAWLVLLFEDRAKGSNIHNYGDALWWSVVTVTTVGYGDRYPVSAGGRAVATALMLIGIGLIGVLTASVASFFMQEHTDAGKQQLKSVHQDLGSQLGELSDRLVRLECLLASMVGAPPFTAPTAESGSAPSGGADGGSGAGSGDDSPTSQPGGLS